MSFQSIVFFLALILVTTVLAGGTSKEGLAFLAKKEKDDDAFQSNQVSYTGAVMGLGFVSLLLCAFFDFRRVETIEDKVKRVLM